MFEMPSPKVTAKAPLTVALVTLSRRAVALRRLHR
jgi:hypothetical protein